MRITLGQLRRVIREEVMREMHRHPDDEGRGMSRADAMGYDDAEYDALRSEFPELDDESTIDQDHPDYENAGSSPPEGWSPPERVSRVNPRGTGRFPMKGGR